MKKDNAAVKDSKKDTKNGEGKDEDESSDEEEHAGSSSSIAELRLVVFLDINLLFEFPNALLLPNMFFVNTTSNSFAI